MQTFSDLLERTRAPAEFHAQWDAAVLQKVEVLKSQSTWKLYLCCRQAVTTEFITRTEEHLLQNFSFLNRLTIIPSLERAEMLQHLIDGKREALETFLQINSGLALSAPMMHWQCQRDYMDIIVHEPELYEQLLSSELCDYAARWFMQEYRLAIVVRVLLRSEEERRLMPELRFVASGPADSLTVTTPSREPYESENGRRTPGGRSRAGSIKELPGSILELEEGMKNAVIEGEIMDRRVNVLKDGRLAVVYDVTDYTDSISVKSFMDRAEEEKIAPGDWVRIKGGVRYDQFLKEIVMFLDRYMPMKRPQRQDQAPQRRVELHAHTKMSDMDGLTEIEELVKRAAEWGHPALAITDHGCVQAFPAAHAAAKQHNIKILYGVEGYLVEQNANERPWHIIILARNQVGLRHLYELVSDSYLDNFYKRPKITRTELAERREGLLLGTACEAGELFQALLRGASDEELAEIVAFYDYLEIQPLCNNQFLVRQGRVADEAELENLNRRIVELGRRFDKPVVATGDVHFLDPEDEIFRTIVQAGKGYDDSEESLPLYYRTTEEMLTLFQYIGEAEALRVVVEAPNQIAAMVEEMQPVPGQYCPPMIEGAEQEVVDLSWHRARELYGDPLPPVVEERVRRELDSIVKHGFSVLYLIAHKLVKKSNEDGYLVGSRGSVGSSLVAYLTGITEVNPLPPHYVCNHCSYSEFFAADNLLEVGVDLPDKLCPNCEQLLNKSGCEIPFETFLGFDGDKVPDIDLNFSGDYQAQAHKYVEELFGSGNVFKAGTISTVAERTAIGFVLNYIEERDRQLRRPELERLARGISGVKRTTGQHPGGMIVVPSDHSIYEFTPVQHPADKKDSGIVTTHFDYHSLDEQLVKLDILGHDDPTVLRHLQDLTEVKTEAINLSDQTVMQLFSGVEVLGLQPQDIDSEVGTFGIPEFGTRFVRQMLEVARPTTFAELVRVSGLSHGTDVWKNNAETLIKEGTASLAEAICIRDDIMRYLIQKGLEKNDAFQIMENVRKGKGLKLGEEELMRRYQVPEWYIDSCKRIKYMFPRAHAVAYVTMAYRIAWFKLYHPLAFYAAFFTVRAADFEMDTMLAGYDEIRRRIKEIGSAKRNEVSAKDENLQTMLELALEMCARGYHFYPIDLYHSADQEFVLKEDGLLLPFLVLPGVGSNAARKIIEARNAGPFISVEEFQQRSRLNRTAVELLRQSNCFMDLPESNQMDLF